MYTDTFLLRLKLSTAKLNQESFLNISRDSMTMRHKLQQPGNFI